MNTIDLMSLARVFDIATDKGQDKLMYACYRLARRTAIEYFTGVDRTSDSKCIYLAKRMHDYMQNAGVSCTQQTERCANVIELVEENMIINMRGDNYNG